MARRIWKYSLEATDRQELELPFGAKVIHVAAQGEDLCIWVLWDEDTPVAPEVHTFWVVGTGNPVPVTFGGKYLGTAHMPPFVWHVFGSTA